MEQVRLKVQNLNSPRQETSQMMKFQRLRQLQTMKT